MRVTILGAGGFIGSHLVGHLTERGHHVTGIDVTDEKLDAARRPAFVFHHGDIGRDRDLLSQVVRDADVVVDLVAYANPSVYVESPLEVFELNFLLNLNVAELCIEHGKRLIQYSSAEVYGKANGGESFSEDTSDLVLGPVRKQRWMYATCKLLLERVLHAHGLKGTLDYTVVRPFNFIGSRLDYLVPAGTMGGPRVFPHFMSALLTGGPLYLVDGGTVHRAFMHIDDANAALEAILTHPNETRHQIYNIGNPANNVTIRELAELMVELYRELTGVPPQSQLISVDGEEFYGRGYEDGDRLPPDVTKLRRLGWEPKHDLRATFRDAMQYYVKRREELLALLVPRPNLRAAGGV